MEKVIITILLVRKLWYKVDTYLAQVSQDLNLGHLVSNLLLMYYFAAILAEPSALLIYLITL